MADDEQAVRIAREVVLSTFAGEAKTLTWAFRRISSAMEDLHLEEGAFVYEEGHPALYQYFVVDGEVRLKGEDRRDDIFGPKSAVGMLDAVLDRAHSRNAVVTRKAHLLRIRVDDWFDVLEDSLELSRIVLNNIAGAVRRLRLRPAPLGGFDEQPRPSRPPSDSRSLHLVDRVLLFRGIPVFGRASIQTLASLAEVATEARPEAGELLGSRGDPKRKLIIVASGEISVTCDAPAPPGKFGPGSLVGGALAVGDTTELELRASSPSQVLEIARDDYFDVMEEHFGLFRSTLRALAEELDTLSHRR